MCDNCANQKYCRPLLAPVRYYPATGWDCGDFAPDEDQDQDPELADQAEGDQD